MSGRRARGAKASRPSVDRAEMTVGCQLLTFAEVDGNVSSSAIPATQQLIYHRQKYCSKQPSGKTNISTPSPKLMHNITGNQPVRSWPLLLKTVGLYENRDDSNENQP